MAALVTGTDMKVAPVFDSTGAVVSDPTGTLANANRSGDMAPPAMLADVKISPVYDSTGRSCPIPQARWRMRTIQERQLQR